MIGNEAVKTYLEISDVMYEALKARQYEIFENALGQREALIKQITGDENVFSTATQEQKTKWQLEISAIDKKLSDEMEAYRKSMENELAVLQQEQGKLRKQESVNRYSASQEQGATFDKMK